jgi:hypothetical protein
MLPRQNTVAELQNSTHRIERAKLDLWRHHARVFIGGTSTLFKEYERHADETQAGTSCS